MHDLEHQDDSRCWYCTKRPAQATCKHTARLYSPARIVGRESSGFGTVTIQASFQSLDIETPRCRTCRDVHEFRLGAFAIFALIGGAVAGFALWSTATDMWGWVLFALGISAAIAVVGAVGYVAALIVSFGRAPLLMKWRSYPPARVLLEQGWKTTKPSAYDAKP